MIKMKCVRGSRVLITFRLISTISVLYLISLEAAEDMVLMWKQVVSCGYFERGESI